MAFPSKGIMRVLAILYLAALHAAVVYLAVERLAAPESRHSAVPEAAVPVPTELEKVPTPPADPSPAEGRASPKPEQTSLPPGPPPPAGTLIVPVAGVRPDQLYDSFADARSEDRVHDAIDIPSPAGTPVIAAADGEIVKFFDSENGGITIYQLSADRRFIYYYAHLQSRAADVNEGDTVSRGRTIGFVGDTGNAGVGNYHLHFAITAVTDPKRYWEGTNINPYPLLRTGELPR